MTRDWEATFDRWSSPPGSAEQERIENAVRAVRKALDADDKLSPVTRVYVQGSYRNRVNVRQESDVDLGVLYTGGTFGVDYPEGKVDSDFGNTAARYDYREFKNDLEQALVKHFGRRAVQRGDKAFDIHENTYRLDADVVPMFLHRRYQNDGTYISGVQFNPDSGGRIVNWPERLYDNSRWPDQHYENGVSKNTTTGHRYKGVARIVKSLQNEMNDTGIAAAKPILGFEVECLVWNVPNVAFGRDTWSEDVQASFAFLWGNTRSDDMCSEWGEVSELKYLFKGSPQKRQRAHAFIDAAWSYVGVHKP